MAHKGKRIFLFLGPMLLLLNFTLPCPARAEDFAGSLRGGFKATANFAYRETGRILGPTVGPAVQGVQKGLYNSVVVNSYNRINSASTALTGAGLNQHINTAFQLGVVKPYNAVNIVSNAITGVGINQNINTASQCLNYIKDTNDGINIWQQDTALGVAQWVKDTHRGVMRYGGNALNMAAKGNVAVLPYTVDSFFGGVSDAGDRLECFQRDAGERLDEWTKDDPLKEDHVDRQIRELGLTGVDKPQVTRALHDMGMFTSEERVYKKDLKQLILNRINPVNDGRPLAVIIQSKSDHNGAMTEKTRKDIIHNILSNAGRVYYAQADTDTKAQYIINSATENGNNPANLIYIAGHGSQGAINLGQTNQQAKSQQNFLDTDNDQGKLSTLQDRLAPGGSVILHSCSTGKGGDTGLMLKKGIRTELASGLTRVEVTDVGKEKPLNVVNMLANAFPQAKMVVGPTKDIYQTNIMFDRKGAVVWVGYDFNHQIGTYNGIDGKVTY